MLTFEKILKKVAAYRPDCDRERLLRAYEYASKFHEGQYRLSGDPYMSHVLAVLDILLSLKPDDDTIIAAILHGLTSQTYNEPEIRELFGVDAAQLVEAVASLRRVKSREQKSEAESIRRMFMTMAKDIRVILIKMADRLHNMDTIGFHTLVKQKQIARETLDVYVPISARLGIYHLKGQLEDRAFKCLYPRQYEHLKTDLEEYMVEREESIDDMKKELKTFLNENGIEAKLEGRVKNLYSIYRKLKLKNHATLADLHDVFAIRIILPTKYNSQGKEVNEHLYSLLGLIHSKWRPIAERFKDYVALPKANGYQSLHTAVVGLSLNSSRVTEIQIRSQRMHDEAEYGIASHWIYEDTKKMKGRSHYSVEKLGENRSPIKKYVDWIEGLSDVQEQLKNGKELIKALKIDVFSDRIYIMTPSGEVKDLPQGATPVDFAYAIHTDIGHRCQLAKVNGNVVPLDYKLKNGDIVEIVLGKNHDPKPIWLSTVRTSNAKTKIRAFIRSMDKEYSFREGKTIINGLLEKMGKPPLDEALSIFRIYNGKRFSMKERIGLIEEIGNGSVMALPILKNVFGQSGRGTDRVQRPLKFVLPQKKGAFAAQKDEVFIAGEMGLPYRFANCCKPTPGLAIVGYINRGNSVTVHLQSCKHLRHASPERILEAGWGMEKISTHRYPVKLKLVAKDRVGLIRDIADVVTGMNVNIIFFSDLGKVDDLIHRELILEVSDNEQYDEIIQRLLRVRNILEVRRADVVSG